MTTTDQALGRRQNVERLIEKLVGAEALNSEHGTALKDLLEQVGDLSVQPRLAATERSMLILGKVIDFMRGANVTPADGADTAFVHGLAEALEGEDTEASQLLQALLADEKAKADAEAARQHFEEVSGRVHNQVQALYRLALAASGGLLKHKDKIEGLDDDIQQALEQWRDDKMGPNDACLDIALLVTIMLARVITVSTELRSKIRTLEDEIYKILQPEGDKSAP